ncbi:hypothetical protein [Ilumatobacter sp.]|uniref:hypothetical protein n=1 Tax=Ilumatobacter sp. TaxID=1967498 RepID=UPI003C6F12EC
MPRAQLILVTVASVALAACSGGDSTSDASAAEDPYVDALLDDLETDPEFPIGEAEAECIARGAVQAIGVESLESADVSPEELAQAPALADLDADLGSDIEARLTERISECDGLADVIVAGVTADLGVTDGSLDCVTEEFDVEKFSALLASSLLDGGDSGAVGEAFGEDVVLGLSDDCSKQLFLAIGVAEGAIDEGQLACLEDELDPAVTKQLIAAEDGDSDAAADAIESAQAALSTCGVDT